MGRLTSRCLVEGYATGNFSAEQASNLTSVVESLLKVRLFPGLTCVRADFLDWQSSSEEHFAHVRHASRCQMQCIWYLDASSATARGLAIPRTCLCGLTNKGAFKLTAIGVWHAKLRGKEEHARRSVYLQEKLHVRPLFPSQRPQKRVLRLGAGAPALLSIPAPNEENDNSAIVLTYQVRGVCLGKQGYFLRFSVAAVYLGDSSSLQDQCSSPRSLPPLSEQTPSIMY